MSLGSCSIAWGGLLVSTVYLGCQGITGLDDFRTGPDDSGTTGGGGSGGTSSGGGSDGVGGSGGTTGGSGGGGSGGTTGGSGGGGSGGTTGGSGGATGGSGGTSLPPCTATQLDCDGDTTNGCETDTLTSSSHCGSCERDCLGAPCDGGVCAPTVIGQYGYSDVTVDDTHVYWTVNGGGPTCETKLYRCALPDCATEEPFADDEGIAYGVVVDATDVWWGVGSGFARRPKSAVCDMCDPTKTTACTLLEHGSPDWWLAQDGANLYWTDWGGGLMGQPKSGGASVTLDVAAQNCQPAVSEGSIFYCRGGGIWTCNLSNGCSAPTIVAEPLSTDSWHVWEVAAHAGVPYWVDAGGRVFGCASKDCGKNPKVIAEKPGEDFLAISADADGVYFASGSGRVFSCPLSGCTGAPKLLTLGMGSPRQGGIAVGPTHVYVSADTVFSVAK